jgi:IS30 family transposase
MTQTNQPPTNLARFNPHSPWQKGGVENVNGRIRRHLPLASVAEERSALAGVAERLNTTPRRYLGYRTPAEGFASHLTALPSW